MKSCQSVQLSATIIQKERRCPFESRIYRQISSAWPQNFILSQTPRPYTGAISRTDRT